MIRHCQGDLLASGAEALVNPVNCIGVAGAGLALAFRQAYPTAYESYRRACVRGEVVPGKVFFVGIRPVIICFPTKGHWKSDSRLVDIRVGLTDLRRRLIGRVRPVESIAVPALGCGLGGLDWQAVRPLIEAALGDIAGLEVMLYEPSWRQPSHYADPKEQGS